MGIKGIYKEIGAGERVSLCKIATEHLERHPNRPFRLAIDVSIWQFQIQAARGGSNPAIRTMFYRLARMLGHGIDPIFVFDGPKKPEFKRNKRSGRGDGARVSDAMAKRLVRHFGFVAHDAPGEAEAECALLQRKGIVDAVLSEDVDTIMFGCAKTFRNWSADGSTSKTPTHVTVYDAAEVAAGKSGLDREGMVLAALMSGGDYIPEGIPGCGVKVACEAARAGFGRDLCRLKKSDTEGLKAWRERLMAELRSNESGFFRTRHKALAVPADFPNLEVLRYYTHPVVSNEDTLDRLDQELHKPRHININALREFVRETFDWDYKPGAIKFIRVLAPSILVQRLVKRFDAPDLLQDDLDAKEVYEGSIVKKITSRRTHASTDGTPELRVSFIPASIVGIDLSLEAEEPPTSSGRSGLALNSDEEFDEEGETGKKVTVKKPFDPSEADLTWVPESIVEMGVPLLAGDFKDQQRSKQAAKNQRAAKAKVTRAKTASTTTGSGPMDRFMHKVVKIPSSSAPVPASKPVSSQQSLPGASQKSSSRTCPPEPLDLDDDFDLSSPPRVAKPAKSTASAVKKGTQPKKSSQPKRDVPSDVNPWTIAKSLQSPSKPLVTAKIQAFSNSPILIASSPVVPAQTSSPLTSIGQVTPTKRTKAVSNTGSTSSDDSPPSPTPTPRPRACRSQSVAKELSASPKPPQQPARRARQFKRTKSGAEEDSIVELDALEPVQTKPTRPASTQAKLVQTKLTPLSPARPKPAETKSHETPLPVPLPGIKGYMPVTKRATATALPAKPTIRSDPIHILDLSSDDDDEQVPDLLKKPHAQAKNPSIKTGLSNTSLTPSLAKTRTTALPQNLPTSSSKEKRLSPVATGQSTTKSSPPPRRPTTDIPRSVDNNRHQHRQEVIVLSDSDSDEHDNPHHAAPTTDDHEDDANANANDESIGDISGFSDVLSGGRLWRRREIEAVDLTGDDGDVFLD